MTDADEAYILEMVDRYMLTRTSLYGLRTPASCVLYVAKAQGSLPPAPGPYALPVYVRRTRTSLRRAVPTAYRGITGGPKPHGHHPPLRGSRGVRDLEERARIGLRTKPGELRRVHLHDPLVLPYKLF